MSYLKDIFFTSLREAEHPNNDFTKVKKIVMDSMNDWQDQLVLTAENTLKKLQHEHDTYLREEKQDRMNMYEEVLATDDWENRDDILEQYEKLTRQTELFSFEQWNVTFEEQRKELLANVALMPADVREKLRDYLESKQEDFKVGGLFTAKRKTEVERQRRAAEAFDAYQQVVQSQITGHIKMLMKNTLKDVGALTEQRASAIDEIAFVLPFSVIEEQIQKGALLTGDAVLNFANRVAEATKRYFIQATDSWKTEQATVLEQVAREASAPVRLKINAMLQKVEAIRQIQQIEVYQQFSDKQLTQVTNETRAVIKRPTLSLAACI